MESNPLYLSKLSYSITGLEVDEVPDTLSLSASREGNIAGVLAGNFDISNRMRDRSASSYTSYLPVAMLLYSANICTSKLPAGYADELNPTI